MNARIELASRGGERVAPPAGRRGHRGGPGRRGHRGQPSPRRGHQPAVLGRGREVLVRRRVQPRRAGAAVELRGIPADAPAPGRHTAYGPQPQSRGRGVQRGGAGHPGGAGSLSRVAAVRTRGTDVGARPCRPRLPPAAELRAQRHGDQRAVAPCHPRRHGAGGSTGGGPYRTRLRRRCAGPVRHLRSLRAHPPAGSGGARDHCPGTTPLVRVTRRRAGGDAGDPGRCRGPRPPRPGGTARHLAAQRRDHRRRPRRPAGHVRRGGARPRLHVRCPARPRPSRGDHRRRNGSRRLRPDPRERIAAHLRPRLLRHHRALPAGPDRHAPGLTAWTSLATSDGGERYFLSAEIAWFVCLAWAISQIPWRLVMAAAGVALAATFASGLIASWQYAPYTDFHPAAYTAQLRAAAPGTTVVIPVNPGGPWAATLVRHYGVGPTAPRPGAGSRCAPRRRSRCR